jgi:hypothetical protein
VKFPSAREAQIRLEKVGEIRFLVRRGTSYTEEDDRRLRTEIGKWIQDGSKISIEHVDEIERTARGKLRFVVSSVPAKEAAEYRLPPPPALLALENRDGNGA